MIRSVLDLWNRSFKAQLIIGMGVVLTLLILGFAYLTVTKEKEILQAEVLKQIKNRSLALATMSKTWVMANDYAGLEEVLNNFSIYKDIVFASVIDMEGKVIAHTDASLVGKYIADEKRISYLRRSHLQDDGHSHDEEVVFRDVRHIDMIRMIHNKQKHIGMINLRLDQKDRQKKIHDAVFQGVVFAIISVFTALTLLYLIVSRFTRELSQFMRTIRQVKEGDKSVRAKEEGVKELHELSHEFNRALDALSQSELAEQKIKEQYEFAIKGTRDGLWDFDIENNTLYFSARWKEMLGYEESELVNTFDTWESRVHPDDIEQAKRDMASSQERPGVFYENIHRLKHKEGHWVWILSRGQTLFNEEDKAVRMVGFHTDISKQKQLEQELMQKEELMILQSRYSAIGETIGMIAHQWRQPLSVIAMDVNTILVRMELGQLDDGLLKDISDQILDQTVHLSKTISDFRNFFAPEREKEKVFLRDVLDETQTILSSSLYANEIVLSIDNTSQSSIYLHKRELTHVLINLINNARDAFSEQQSKEKTIKISISETEDTLVIMVCDNAGGIKASIIEKIFDPYFTTKSEFNGTGLGLYMSKTIITKHLNGNISVKNADGGACFTIELPKETLG